MSYQDPNDPFEGLPQFLCYFLLVACLLFWLVLNTQKAKACTQPGPDEDGSSECDPAEPVTA